MSKRRKGKKQKPEKRGKQFKRTAPAIATIKKRAQRFLRNPERITERDKVNAHMDRAALLNEYEQLNSRSRRLLALIGKTGQEREAMLLFCRSIAEDESQTDERRLEAQALIVWSTRSVDDYKRHTLEGVKVAIERAHTEELAKLQDSDGGSD